MNIEPLVRGTIQAHAGDAPPADRLAAAAWRRARRRRTRRVVASATAVAAAVALGAAVPTLAERTEAGPALVPAAPGYGLPELPYTPGWVPDGLAEGYPTLSVVSDAAHARRGHVVEVVHERDGAAPQEEAAPLILAAHSVEPTDYWQFRSLPVTGTEQVTVRGRTATLTTGDGAVTRAWLLTWQERPDLWISVYAEQELGRAALLRYVAELVPEPFPVTPPATMAVLPAGTELYAFDPSTIRLSSPPEWQEPPPRVVMFIDLHDPANVDQVRDGAPVTVVEVNGQPAELADSGGFDVLSLPVAPDLMVSISSSGLALPDLLTFAEGVAVTPDARPEHFPEPGD